MTTEIIEKRGRGKRYPPAITKQKKQEFLDRYLELGSYTATLKAIGISSPGTLGMWTKYDPDFKAKYLALKDIRADILEGDMYQYARGEVKATQPQVTSGIFLLKAFRPDIYTDKAQLLTALENEDKKSREDYKNLLLLLAGSKSKKVTLSVETKEEFTATMSNNIIVRDEDNNKRYKNSSISDKDEHDGDSLDNTIYPDNDTTKNLKLLPPTNTT